MADPILGLLELAEGDSLGYLRQNDRNLILARLTTFPKVVASNQTYPSGSVARGDLYIVPASATSHWSGVAANTLAVALSDSPNHPSGWFFLAPDYGYTCWILAGTTTGHVVWNGSAFTAV